MGRVSAKEAVKILGITYPTLALWVFKKIVKRHKVEVAGRDYYEYDSRKLKKIRSTMKRNLQRGQSYLVNGHRS